MKSWNHLTEGFVIVVSILLAFGIEASWAEFSEFREANRLLESLRDDAVAMQAEIAQQRAQSQALEERARHLLVILSDPPDDESLREALLTLGSVFVTGRWDPPTDSYDEALNSGRLSLIGNDEIRLALTRYYAQAEEIDLIFQEMGTQYYTELEPFMVQHTVYSELAAEWWRESLVEAPFKTDISALGKSRQLWNLLTFRLEIEIALQSRLGEMGERSAILLGLLSEAVGSGAS